MAYIQDLTTFTYGGGRTFNPKESFSQVLAVGWLDPAHDFETISEDQIPLVQKLQTLSVCMTYRGSHFCPWCQTSERSFSGPRGNGQYEIVSNDVLYVAPVLITHYIQEHQYKPPQAFVDAVLSL